MCEISDLFKAVKPTKTISATIDTRINDFQLKRVPKMKMKNMRASCKGPSIKDVRPDGWGGQPKVDDHGRGGRDRLLNRTSISENFEQIFCVSDSENTPSLVHGRPRIARPWTLPPDGRQAGGGVQKVSFS